VKGEIAGTQLTNTIFGLTDRALKAPAAFEKLGISVFDAEGNMRNFADIADDLGSAFQGMTEEQKLAELGALGFTKQARAGVLMLSGQGDKIREYEEALRDAAGFTEDVAKKQLLTPTAQFALLQSAMTDVAIEIGSFLAPALGDMAMAFAPLINDALPAITDFLERRIGPAVQRATEFIQNFSVSVQEGSFHISWAMEDLVARIVEFFTGDGLKKMLDSFIAIRQSIFEGFIRIIPIVLGALVEMLPAIVRTIADMLPTILKQAVDTFMALVDAVVIILPQLLKALLDMLPSLIKTIIGLLPSIIEAAIKLFTGLITALVKVVPDLVETLIDSIPEIVDAIIDALPLIIEAAFTLFAGIITALMRQWPEIIAALGRLFPKLISGIIGHVPKMVDAGFQLIKGLAKGLIDNIPRLLGEAASAIGNALTNGVKAVFQIKSPSRVFMDIGSDVVSGLEEGITDNLRMLENASLGMASTVTGTVESGLSNMSTPIPLSAPMQGSAGSMQLNVTVNAGMGADGADIGRKIVDEILRFERSSGRVFVRA
jgi:phage-related protein